MSYLNSILNNSKKFDNPFEHWELNKPLTDEQINEIVSAASDSDTDNQLLDPGVSAVATTPTDDEDINENKRKKSHPYVMTLPSGLVYSFDYGIK